MKIFGYIILLTLGLCITTQTSWAEKVYVTDSFKITLRTGPSIQNKIIVLLRSGHLVEVLETQDDWSHVRLLEHEEGALEGWLLSRYLITREPWEIQARVSKEEIARLRKKLAYIEKEWRETARREEGITGELKEKTSALSELQDEYATLKRGSSDYLKLRAEYETTWKRLETSQKAVQTLNRDNESLRSSQRDKWFATGALILLCGLMIGIVLGKQQRKHKALLYK
ncbi:MAG: TIGR04211 family SH3 domain-containing protein [Thermodesulfobacteriota bacterium]|nr:TIGR04211 family SH3 domain-containing protein [Thermodesulfobacteriota bacterium]